MELKGNIADLLVRTLAATGVRRIYGIVGDSLNGVAETLRALGQIDWMLVRNDEATAFAAGSESHLTGAIAVCGDRCGHRNLHLINRLFDFHRSPVPVPAIDAPALRDVVCARQGLAMPPRIK